MAGGGGLAGGGAAGGRAGGAAGGGSAGPAGGSDRRRSYGAAGEDRAARWYEERGYQVVERNWRSGQGEIDLIVRREDVLVFCEVKARTGGTFGEPFEAVTAAKQARLRRLAAEWLRQGGTGGFSSGRSGGFDGRRPAEIRFDVVSIRGGRLEVLEGAF